MSIDFPEYLPLANTPTPLQKLPRLSRELGVEILVKRDDLTGLGMSGNKVRKLEFLLADAMRKSAEVVITGGGEQSNHCRATAIAASRLGLKSHLLLRTQTPKDPPEVTGNILLNKLAGAHIQWISPSQWQERESLFTKVAKTYLEEDTKPYVIPEGGSNAMGSWGYVRAIHELRSELEEFPQQPTTLVYACGSGGTGAGLLLGKKLYGLDVRIVGVNVCNDAQYFRTQIHKICQDFDSEFKTKADVSEGEIEILDGYVGLGYAKSRDEELITIVNATRNEGLLLDPVYSGKAFHALSTELKKNPKTFGERVIFLHTGGAFGLFAVTERLASMTD